MTVQALKVGIAAGLSRTEILKVVDGTPGSTPEWQQALIIEGADVLVHVIIFLGE